MEFKMEDESNGRVVDIWDLPPALAGKILSYKAGTTADIAKLREVGRAFGQAIRSQISSKNARHAIACPGRSTKDKSFVSALTELGWDPEERSNVPGDVLERGGRDLDQSIFSGGATLERIFVLSDGEEVDCGAKSRTRNNHRDAIALIENANSMEEFESICRDAILGGLFKPIQEGGNIRDADGEYNIDLDDCCTQKVMAVFIIPEGSDCIVSTSETYLELRTDDVDGVSNIHPIHPKSLYRATISETKEFGDRKKFRACVLLDLFYDWPWELEGDLVSSLSYDLLKREHQNRIGPVEGVAVVDDFLGEDLVQTLATDINALVSRQEELNDVDYHPHSNGIVRDIVHPGLYSYVKGVTQLRASARDVEPCSLPSYDGDEAEQAPAESENDGYGQDIVDFWGRNEWDKYQWLPTYFDISVAGECNIDHYVNGITPRGDAVNSNLYHSLAKLFEHALPYISSVYSYIRAIRPLIREDGDEGNKIEEIVDLNIVPYDLKGHKLQVITKIVDYELKPGQSHEGVWHIEGMSQEDIVLTALYILDRDDCISGGDLMFKRAFLADEAGDIFWNVSQSRSMALEKEIENGLVPLGKVGTNKGRLIVFPNSHVHKVTEMINEDMVQNSSDVAFASKRRIVVFFLVNPLHRIVSSREVAPQKGGSMTHKDALKHRLELMKVRKYHKQDWNVRDIHLCEH